MIHQLVHTLSYGDAISGEVLALQRCLRTLGHQSEIYAINVHPKYKGLAKDYREFPNDFNGEVILHYSLGSPLNDLYRSLSATRTLIHHNLTPSRWFEGVNPRIVTDIEAGRKELPELCRMTDRLIADSEFNAEELRSLGFAAAVLPLTYDPERWSTGRNEGIYSLVKSEPGIHLLHVGRIAPNKCIEDIIKAFYFLHHHIDRSSRLWLAGIDIDTELYAFSLKRLVHDFKLDHAVNFTGGMADEELRSLYEACSAYVCMSEHEGFCLPVVEAMNFGLPVVSYASSALPETIGSGGILLHEKNPARTAEVLYAAATDVQLRGQLISAGKERVKDFSFSRFESNVKKIFSAPVSADVRKVAQRS